MLNPITQGILKRSVELWKKENAGDISFLQECGPAKLIDEQCLLECDVVGCTPDDPDNIFSQDVRNNRQEAEQFMAGLLGMC